MDRHIDLKSVFKIAGAFIAWTIGAGFATGREVLQFFQLWIHELCGSSY